MRGALLAYQMGHADALMGHADALVDGERGGGGGSVGAGAGAAPGAAGAAQDVLVYKPPGAHPGDVRKLRNVRTDALDALVAGVDAERCNGIFFSTRGRRAAADLMAGSDYDGDEFVVIAEPQLVANFAEAEAWDAPPPPPSGVPGVKAAADVARHDAPEQLQRQLALAYLERVRAASLVGRAALALDAQADLLGCDDSTVKRLVTTYYLALDGLRQGQLDPGLDTKVHPEWMRGRSKRTDLTFRESPEDSAVGYLFARLRELGGASPASAAARRVRGLDNDLLLPGRKGYELVATASLKRYGELMAALMRGREAAEADEEGRRVAVRELQARMREEKLQEYRDRDPGALFDVTIAPPTALLLEVSAAYEANYRQRMRAEERRAAAAAGGDEHVAAAEAQGERGDGLSFVWGLYGDLLRRIKSNVLRQRTIAAPLG